MNIPYVIAYGTNAVTAMVRVITDKLYDYYNNKEFNVDTDRLYTQSTVLSRTLHFFGDPIHIIDNIYLGSAYNAASFYKLKNNRIKIIVNATKEISNYYPDDFIYHNYELLDTNNDSINAHLNEVYKIINDNPNDNILIHCFMGASRSASFVLYYIMKKYNKTLDEALQYALELRSIININSTFAAELDGRQAAAE